MSRVSLISSLDGRNKIIAVLDPDDLHKLFITKISKELANLVKDCYYPKVADIYKELLHRTQSTEKELLKYSKEKYKNPKWKILHDPQTTLLVLICEKFLTSNDYAAALAVFNLLSLRFYTNLMYRYIKFCNPNFFRAALDKLSHNHLFTTKKTVGSSILYLSKQVFEKYKEDVKNQDPQRITAMIYELRTRFNQSMKSFYNKYYKMAELGLGTAIESEEELELKKQQETLEQKIKQFSDKIAKDITVYRRIDKTSAEEARKLTKFNKTLSAEYVDAIRNTDFLDDLQLGIYLYIKSLEGKKKLTKLEYVEQARRLMAIKVTKQQVYFKKTVISIHDRIVDLTGHREWYDRLSVQSQGVSRLYLAYYIALVVANNFIQEK